jgi:hypothetical protein
MHRVTSRHTGAPVSIRTIPKPLDLLWVKLRLIDLEAPFTCALLDDPEAQRSATTRTRNLRLTSIRSFFRYASFEAPAHSAHIQRVLAISTKRCDERQLHFLTYRCHPLLPRPVDLARTP